MLEFIKTLFSHKKNCFKYEYYSLLVVVRKFECPWGISEFHVLGLVLGEVGHGALGGAVPRPLLLLLQSLLCRVFLDVFFDLLFVVVGPVQVHGRRVPVERIDRVRVRQQLRQERLEDIRQVIESCPGLIDYI